MHLRNRRRVVAELAETMVSKRGVTARFGCLQSAAVVLATALFTTAVFAAPVAAQEIGGGEGLVVPGRIEAEAFGSDYVDLDDGNLGSASDLFPGDVDVWKTLREDGYLIGRIRPGEYTTYEVTAEQTANYRFTIRTGSGNPDGGVATLSIDDVAIAPKQIPTSGDWWGLRTDVLGDAILTAGSHTVKVAWGEGQVNFDRLDVSIVPFAVDPVLPIPGPVEAEYFASDYSDSDPLNRGSAAELFADDVQVDVWKTVGADGFTVGRIRPGEYTTYEVEAEEAGEYSVSLQSASGNEVGGEVTLSVDGVASAPIQVEPTGDWWDFAATDLGTIDLTAGRHTIGVLWGAGQVNFDRLDFTPVDAVPPTPTPTVPPVAPTCAGLSQEAEDGVLSGNMTIGEDALASGGRFVLAPNGGSRPDGDDYVEFCVVPPSSGIYKMDARVLAATNADDSFFVSVLNGPQVLWDTSISSTWVDDSVSDRVSGSDPVRFGMAANGQYKVRVWQRENGTQLDSFSFVKVGGTVNYGVDVPATPTPTPTTPTPTPVTPTPTPTPVTPTPTPVTPTPTPTPVTPTPTPTPGPGANEVIIDSVEDGAAIDVSPAGAVDQLATGSFELGGEVGSEVASITISVEGESAEATISDGVWEREVTPPNSGTYDFLVEGFDAAGSLVSSETITLDLTAPADDETLYTPEFVDAVLDAPVAVDYRPEADEVVFDGDQRNAIEVGMVLSSLPTDFAPDGFVRIAETIDFVDGQTIVTGRNGGIGDVFRQFDFDEVVSSEPAIGAAQADDGEAAADVAAQFDDGRVFETIPATARRFGVVAEIEGEASFDLDAGVDTSVTADIDIDWCNGYFCTAGPGIDYFKFEATATAYAEARFEAMRAASVTKDRELFDIELARWFFGPVMMTVELETTAVATAEFSAEATAVAQWRKEITAGYEYRKDGQGLGVYKENPPGETGYRIEGAARFTAEAGLDFALEFKLFDVVGPEVVVGPGIGFAAEVGAEFIDEDEVEASVWLELKAAAFVQVSVGLDADIWGPLDDILEIEPRPLLDPRPEYVIWSERWAWEYNACGDEDDSGNTAIVQAGLALPDGNVDACEGLLREAIAERLKNGSETGPNAALSLTDAQRESAAQSCVHQATEAGEDARDYCLEGQVFYSAYDGQAAVTNHIADALRTGPSDWAVLTFEDRRNESRGGWYYEANPAFPSFIPCVRMPGSGQDCDEYPFFSSDKGYHAGQAPPLPSVKMIDRSQNRSHGGSMGFFVDQCPQVAALGAGVEKQPYLVVITDFDQFETSKSFWTCPGRGNGYYRGVKFAVTVEDDRPDEATPGDIGTLTVTAQNATAKTVAAGTTFEVPLEVGISDPSPVDDRYTCGGPLDAYECSLPEDIGPNIADTFDIQYTVCDAALGEETCSKGFRSADLRLSVEQTTGFGTQVGDTVMLEHSLLNTGPQIATTVSAQTVLPASVSDIALPDDCTLNGSTVTCSWLSLDAGAREDWTITAVVIDAEPAPSEMNATAAASADQFDPTPAEVTVAVFPQTDFKLDDVVAGRLASAAEDKSYVFVVPDGIERIYIDFEECFGPYEPRWELMTAEGTQQTGYCFGTYADVTPGLYSIRIFSGNGDFGDYRFKVWGQDVERFDIELDEAVSDGVPAAGAGNLESPVAEDLYTFAVPNGVDRLFVDIGPCEVSTPEWTLIDAAGDSVGDERNCGGLSLDVTAGDLTLRVFTDEAEFGPYDLTVVAGPSADEFNIAIGDAITDGTPAVGAGNLEAPAAVDRYAFVVPDGYDKIHLAFERCSEEFNLSYSLRWELVDATGEVVVGSCGDSFPEVTPGNHMLRVFSIDGTVGTYDFSLLPPPEPEIFEIALGDSVSDGVPAPGAGNLEYSASEDRYNFEVPAGVGSIFLDSSACYYLGFRPRISLFNADGEVASSETSHCLFEVTPGHYTISVTDTYFGPYEFALLAVPDPESFVISLGQVVTDGVPGPGAGNLETLGSEDRYTFTLPGGGGPYAVDFDNYCRNFGWELVTPSGAIITPVSWDCKYLPFGGNEGGEYLFRVFRRYDQRDVDPYTFSISPIS